MRSTSMRSKMRSERSARTASALVAAFLILPIAPSHGVETPAPSPSATPSPSPTITRTPMEQYKYEKELYALALKKYNLEVMRINQNFKLAIDKANIEYRNARDKFSAKTALRSATAAAIALRDAAITELGARPTAPAEPPKAARVGPNKDNPRPRK